MKKRLSKVFISITSLLISACQISGNIAGTGNKSNQQNINDKTYDLGFSTKSGCYDSYDTNCNPSPTPNPDIKPTPPVLIETGQCKRAEIIDLSTLSIAPFTGWINYDYSLTHYYSDPVKLISSIESESVQGNTVNYLVISGATGNEGKVYFKGRVGINGYGGQGIFASDVMNVKYEKNNYASPDWQYSGTTAILEQEGNTLLLSSTAHFGTIYMSTNIHSPLVSYTKVIDSSPSAEREYQSCLCSVKQANLTNINSKIDYQNNLIDWYTNKISEENSKTKPNQTKITNWQSDIDKSLQNIIEQRETYNKKEETYNETCVSCDAKREKVTVKIDNAEESLDFIANISSGIDYINNSNNLVDENISEDEQLETFSLKALPTNEISQGEYFRSLALRQSLYNIELKQSLASEAERKEFDRKIKEETDAFLKRIDGAGGLTPSGLSPIFKSMNMLSNEAFIYVSNNPKFIEWSKKLKNVLIDRTGLQTCPVGCDIPSINSLKSELNSLKDKVKSIFLSVGKPVSIKFGKSRLGILYNYDKKISKQVSKRGWTDNLIEDIIDNSSKKYKTIDARMTPSGVINNEPATVYFNSNNTYVVRNDISGNIVQVSGRNDAGWLPDLANWTLIP